SSLEADAAPHARAPWLCPGFPFPIPRPSRCTDPCCRCSADDGGSVCMFGMSAHRADRTACSLRRIRARGGSELLVPLGLVRPRPPCSGVSFPQASQLQGAQGLHIACCGKGGQSAFPRGSTRRDIRMTTYG